MDNKISYNKIIKILRMVKITCIMNVIHIYMHNECYIYLCIYIRRSEKDVRTGGKRWDESKSNRNLKSNFNCFVGVEGQQRIFNIITADIVGR